MRGEQPILAFNRGMLSRLAMARTDLKRYAMSAEVQTNWMPRVLGSAMLRPGLGYLGSSRGNERAKYLDFIFSADDTALLELTDSTLRVWVDDELVVRPSVATSITNSSFATNLTGWTDIDQTSQTVSQWVAGGYMGLAGYAGSYAGRRQSVSVSSADRGVVHGLRVVIYRGTVDVLVGSTAGAEDYFRVTLGAGTHSLAFTPTGDISVDVVAFTEYETLVSSVDFDVAGTLELPTPWSEEDLPLIRKDQSGDIVFIACSGYRQRKIERRGATSWSVVLYESDDGPLRAINTTRTTIANTTIRGTTVLTASQPVFRPNHLGALFQLESNGQFVSLNFIALDDVTDQIVVTGVGGTREFTVDLIYGGAVGTITLQRSVGDTGVWEDTATTYTATGTTTFNDTLDNQIVAYRLKCTAYTSGTIAGQMRYQYGSITGMVRIISVASSTSAQAVVLRTLGALGTLGNSETTNWREGLWSTYRGWPSAVALYEGRLWWAGKDKWYGSVTDQLYTFDPEFAGDAGPIVRSIGSGPMDVISWLLPLQRLMAGADGSVVAGRSTSLDEPLTPSNFNPKAAITQGAARIAPAKIDDTGVFVQRGGYRVLSLAPASDGTNGFAAEDLSQLVPEIGKPGIVAIAMQRQPDTRIHCVRSDGKVALMIYDKAEDVKCWVLVETDGEVEDAVVLPGAGGEESVYYLVKRTVGGAHVRYLERWAREDESIRGAVCKLADSFVTYTGSNLGHLEGCEVVGWYAGVAYADPVVVSGGSAVGIPAGAVVGLYYEALFKSTKLANLAQPGESGLPSRKKVHSLSLILADTHPQGLRYGQSLEDGEMDDLPLVEGYQLVDQTAVWDAYNEPAFVVPGTWTTDARLCLKAAAPRPCTLLGAIIGLSANSTT